MSETDWFAILKQALESQRAMPPTNSEDVEVLIADIVAGRIRATVPAKPRGTRRRWIAGGSVVLVLASSATAAALWSRNKPDQPQQGIACHASLEVVGGAQVIPPDPDPLEACAQLWLTGVLPDIKNGSAPSEFAPPQFACVGQAGALEVFPSLSDPPTTCEDIGLVEADTNVSDDPLVVLQDRLVRSINETCVDVDTARQIVEVALADVGLDGWTVAVRDNTHGCVFAGEDPDTKSVFLLTNPAQNPTTT
jgi:hypothetical protein